jgi:hypothetical protein
LILKDKEPRSAANGAYLKEKLRDELGEFLFIKTEQRVFNDSLLIEIDVVRLNQTEKSAIETQLFYQIDGKKWQTIIYELDDEDIVILNSGKMVKMIGEVTNINPPNFHACGVFPWLYEKNHTLVELGENRQLMLERISYYNNQQTDIPNQAKNLCANMISIHHMNARFGQ